MAAALVAVEARLRGSRNVDTIRSSSSSNKSATKRVTVHLRAFPRYLEEKAVRYDVYVCKDTRCMFLPFLALP